MIVEQDENMQMELLTPLTANFMPETSYWNELDENDEAWDYEYDGLPLDGTDLVQYKDAIQEMVDKENSFGSEDGKPCNLMQYFDGSPAIKEKVESAVVSVKEVNDVLYGCVTLQLKDHLQSDEMPELCDYITGQYSDGWGEGFEQRDIPVEAGTLNVHFWQYGKDFRFLVASEIQAPAEERKAEETVRRPKMKLLGHDGNIFSIMGDARRLLVRNGQSKEAELQKTGNEQRVMKYLKVFDHIKQYSIQSEISSLPGMARNRMQYKAQIIFLPYLPDPELVKDFEYVQDKQELVWDFAKRAPEKLKKQVFLLLNYILENLYRDDPKERRVRFLLPLHWLYDFCVDEDIEDLERLELSQINQFEKIVEQKVVNVKNSMQIIDNSRKILFLAASEIHWHANVWYMERFHLSEDRLNPISPVQRLSFIEVTNQKNRELLQEYAKYHVGIGGLTIANIRAQLYEVKKLLEYFNDEISICQVDENQLDGYFREQEEKDTKDDTFNKRIVCYLKFYQFLNVRGYIKEIPFQPEYYLKKTYPEHHDRTVEEEVYMEILHKLYLFPQVPKLIFLHLWCTGLRISEVCTLKGDAYYWDGEDAWLKVYQIKMKADKMIPIPFMLYMVMRKYIEKNHIRPKDYIFKGKNGGAYRVATFRKEFQYHCTKNQIADGEYIFKTHDYRHTLATRFYDDGVSIQTIRDYLGHFSEEMTKQYVDFMPKRIEKASDAYFKKPGNDLASAITVKKRGDKK